MDSTHIRSRSFSSHLTTLRRLLGSLLLIGLAWGLGTVRSAASSANGRVVLQAFWWDYWNNNYPADWSTYLADLAPRLREMGIDAVWIPPTCKNKDATGAVGYAPFDHYDLGDKWQGGNTGTRFGTKDDYLRCVAILHANGIEVIQDVVWNHLNGAGSGDGSGGEDPQAHGNRYKNFRYTCFQTPAKSETAANYLARKGRFPKNWQNFHPSPAHDTENGDIAAGWFGPDLCYVRDAYGRSSNAKFNPTQPANYVRDQVRAWSVWLKKQTGVDGFRIDAVKHFEPWACKDFLWNLAHHANDASGGPDMFAVGEYIGNRDQLDQWVDSVNHSDGFADVVGSFDFSLRSSLKSMIDGSGFFDVGSLPSAQEQRRTRAVSFVNSHDSFRPKLGTAGDYVGWDSANELGGHIDPNDARIQVAYAVAFAVDGSPCVFFEDLFDLHSTRTRWTHFPTNESTLPARDYLKNLIWCHENLRFKEGAYLVRWQAADLLVMERQSRAIIGVNDHWTAWQEATIPTSFAPGTRLHDYSGANTDDLVVGATGQVTIHVPPCDGSNRRRGYAVWGPAGITPVPPQAEINTLQEWEMADDLGDSHPKSLGQGGALPSRSVEWRTVGRVYAAANRKIVIDLHPSRTNTPITLQVENVSGMVGQSTGQGILRVEVSPSQTGYLTLKAKNARSSNPKQTVWVKARYTAPTRREP